MSAFPFDAVLFDCDGVLVDSENITNTVLATMLGELGWHLSVDETMRLFVGKTVMDEAPTIHAHTGVTIDAEWIEQFRARRNTELERSVAPIPGIVEAVHELSARLDGRVAVASGADRFKVRLQLQKAGLLDCFEGKIFSGHELGRNKPHPDVYLAAADGLGVEPARCAVIEDSATGATAGVAAGATVFGYSPSNHGHSSHDALRAVGVAQIFVDMQSLPALLGGWRNGRR